tara:strand:- start:642 stop:1016 length:375 start_codon:yes stop_codon:yes gene_type:complete
MKKENLIALLEGAKALSSQVDIDKVIELLTQLEPEVKTEKVLGMSPELADELRDSIESVLRHNAYSDQLVDLDSAEFELDYNNQIRLQSVEVNTDEILEFVSAAIEKFIVEPAADDLINLALAE